MRNAKEILILKIFVVVDMIQTEQWCFEIENSQLCLTEHLGKMFAYIHVVLHSLTTFHITSTMRGSRKCFLGVVGGGGGFEGSLCLPGGGGSEA